MVFDYSSRVPAPYRKYLAYFKPQTLTIDEESVDLLVFKQQGLSQESILITAGFDGDEWDGIMATLKLAEIFSKKRPSVTITILPICNPWGFFAGTSAIPSDNSFPKYYFNENFPSNKASRFVLALFATLIPPFDVWIDLHGGSSHEDLSPFIVGYETQSMVLNDKSMKLLSSLPEDSKYFFSKYSWHKIDALALRDSIYVLSEAGVGMTTAIEAIDLHVSRVQTLVRSFVTSLPQLTAIKKCSVQRELSSFGEWKACQPAGSNLRKGEIIGRLCFLRGLISVAIRATQNGTLLWIRKSHTPKTNEVLFELALD